MEIPDSKPPSPESEHEAHDQLAVRFPSELKTCSVCHARIRKRHPLTGARNFNGSKCHACFNRERRERYHYDPGYRLARKRHTADTYDPAKRREYMRRWRARRKLMPANRKPRPEDDNP